jgi:rod shape-determining protein MreC
LEVVAFLFLLSYNEYPKSSILSTANQVVAWNYKMGNNISSYFHLKATNEALEAENTALRNQIIALQNQLEDSIELSGYTYSHLDYTYIPAKVIQATTNKHNNYLTINKGKRDGVYEGMGVRNAEGVVGIVSTVGEKYSIVLPVINTNSHISCKFVKNGYWGTLEWDGSNYQYAQLIDVASHLSVEPGDTIVTSGLSPIFPADIPVAIVEKAELKEGASYYSIRVRLNTDFRKIGYVQLINKQSYDEIKSLTDEAN